MIVRCVNSDCRNFEAEIDVGDRPLDAETGEPVDIWRVMCGPCGSELAADGVAVNE
jgi:hypothetical protein